MLADDAVLPPLRQELRLEPASASLEGIPRWRLYDPLQHRFYLLGDADVGLLSLWSSGTIGALRKRLAERRQSLDEDAIDELMRFLNNHHLLRNSGRQARQKLAEQRTRQRGHGLRGLINRLLAMRLPLWNPRGLLHQAIPIIQTVGHRGVIITWAVLTVLGLYLTSRQWDQFLGTFADFFSPTGLLGYGCALIGLKILHELGHAYMATVHGVRVGSMGVSIFMGMPMLYTELGDVARLDRSRDRMWIAAGGVLAETFVAGLATLAWAVFPDGTLRSVAFVIATSSWATSLLINLNPLTRFDGYYFLSDALRIDNLQSRAMAFNQWGLGRALFGPVEEAPEHITTRRAWFYGVYGTLAWCYQIFLSCSIAWLAYKTLFRAAGLAILGYALWQFVGRRIWRVVEHWWQLRDVVPVKRKLWLAGFCAVVLMLLVAPLDRHVSVPAMLGNQQQTPVQAPEDSRIEQVLMPADAQVEKGQLLVRFYSPELDAKRAKAQADLIIATERLDRIGGDARDRAENTVLLQQQAQARADLDGLAERARLLEWRAPEAGLLVDVPDNLQAGQWVRPSNTLGRLLHGSQRDATGFIAEKDLPRVQVGNTGVFIADDPSLPKAPVRLAGIDGSASEFITPDSLSSRYGGPIATQADDHNRSVSVSAQHRANLLVDGPAMAGLPLRIRGQVQLDAEPQSLAEQSLVRLWQLLIAELKE